MIAVIGRETDVNILFGRTDNLKRSTKDSAESVCGAITPVPDGVEPMTIAMLVCNCVKAAEMSAGLI